MTSIEKLLIQGIRSFDPKEASVIDFYSPLTLIVGQNGAGKTTIIECLKYTCTGEMPPNCSSGQAFIHDTKIAGESEVKAQIKLRFKNPIGKPIVASRSLSLIQKAKNKQEYKQIDASLQSYTADGNKVSKSFRCSDMDKEIPDLMGVAKPILKHVIFCHQEDSNWPLSESSKLKLKFDEIFSAVKYTKALKSLKDKRKELTATIKELKLRLETVSSNIENCNRIKNDLSKSEQQLSTGNKSLEEIKIEILDKQRTLTSIKSSEIKLNELKSEVSVLNARKLEMERVKNQLFTSLTEVFQESDEELVFMQNSFNNECQLMAEAERELVENQTSLNATKEVINNRLKENSLKFGQLRSMIDQQISIQNDRDKQMKELFTRYKMVDFQQLSQPYSQADVERFISQITQKFDLLHNGIKNLSKSHKQKVGSIQQSINLKKIEQNQITNSTNSKQSSITLNNKKIESIELEINQHTSSIDKIDSLELEIQSLELELKQLELELEPNQFQLKLNQLSSEKVEIEMQIQKLRSSLKLLNLQSTSRTRLNIKRNEVSVKHNQIDQKIKSLNVDQSKLVESILLSNEISNLIEYKNQLVPLISKELKSIGLDELKSDFQVTLVEKNKMDQLLLSIIEPEIKKINNELSLLNNKLSTTTTNGCGQDNISNLNELEDTIIQLKDKLEKSEKSFIILESEDILYKEYIEKANLDQECSLCKNEMNGNELKSFVHTLESHCNDIPNQLSNLRIEIQQFKSTMDHLMGLRPILTKIQELSQSLLPELFEKKNATLKKQIEISQVLNEKSITLRSAELKFSNLSIISNIFEFIDSIKQSITIVENEISKEELEIKKQSSDLRTIEEVEMELEQQTNKLSTEILIEIEKNQKSLSSSNSLIFEKKSKLIDLKNRLTTFKSASGIIDHLRDNKKELQLINQQFFDEIVQLQSTISTTNESITVSTEELNKLELDFEKKMDQFSKEKNTFSVRLDSLNVLQSKICDSTELTNQLESIELENQTLENDLQTITTDYMNGQQHISTLSSNLSNKDITKRAIADNISYRQQQSNVDQISKQTIRKSELITTMEQSITQVSGNGVARLESEINQIKSKFDQITGQTSVLTNQISNCKTELSKPTYKNIDESYKELLIRLATTETIGKDLDKYYKALDKALMKYHNLKMDEINRSIKEIWQTTYKGNDIDTIEIRSEETGTANKTLNYRVVMIKGEVELDMRGRCSAGQKVLACLVIRLALAENFCTNCGILALDEPTSHLDRANIESFANSLLNIIESRKSQKGFQLIIITHDEELVSLMSRGNYSDYYWRITKNQKQHSHIERKEIADI